MALFSRRPKSSSEPDASTSDGSPENARDDAPATPDAPAGESATAEETAPVEEMPQVGISVSSFGGLGAVPTQARAEQSSPPAEEPGILGLSDNVLLRDAIAALPEDANGTQVVGVARQLLQGQLFLRVRGDARTLAAEGKELPLAVATIEGTPFVLVFSSGGALQTAVRADGELYSSAMSQDAAIVLRSVLAGPYGGIILDHASRQSPIFIPRQLLERALEEGDDDFTVKSLLAGERTPERPALVAAALPRVPLWLAANRAREEDEWGLAESRNASGERFLEVFSHPLEVLAMGRGDQPMPIRVDQLASGFEGDDGLTGIVVDPAGPWIQLSRDDLEPAFAA